MHICLACYSASPPVSRCLVSPGSAIAHNCSSHHLPHLYSFRDLMYRRLSFPKVAHKGHIIGRIKDLPGWVALPTVKNIWTGKQFLRTSLLRNKHTFRKCLV